MIRVAAGAISVFPASTFRQLAFSFSIYNLQNIILIFIGIEKCCAQSIYRNAKHVSQIQVFSKLLHQSCKLLCL